MAIIALLESPITSASTRLQLEIFQKRIERDIAALRDDQAEGTAAG
jgi:hypothetical protein